MHRVAWLRWFNSIHLLLQLKKNVWQYKNINPLTAEFIYLAPSAECSGPVNRPTSVKGLDSMKKLNWWIHSIFACLCKFGDYLNFWWCFLWIAYLASIINKKSQIFTKRLPVTTTVPSGTKIITGHWYTGVYRQICEPGPCNPTTFLGLCSIGDYTGS